jgi:hypothetical protein
VSHPIENKRSLLEVGFANTRIERYKWHAQRAYVRYAPFCRVAQE